LPPADTAANPAENVADLLREQLRECHHFVQSCFADAASARANFDMQQSAMRLAARLMQASANTAAAISRLEGNKSRQDIVVTRAEAAGLPSEALAKEG